MIKKVELIIEKNSIDLFGDESFPLTFSIDEINDIGKKAAGFSREINIPATQLNNEIFTALYDVSVEGGFNPISRKYSTLLVDGVPIMRGYFKLLGVNIKDNEYVTYRGLLYEEQINFIQALDEFELTNLNMPATTVTSTPSGFQQTSTFVYSGLTQQYGRRRTTSGTAVGNAINFGGLVFSAGTHGTLTQETRTPVIGIQYVPTTVATYTASVDQSFRPTGTIVLKMINNGGSFTPVHQKLGVRISKLDYNNPLGGTFTVSNIFGEFVAQTGLVVGGGFQNLTFTIPTLSSVPLGVGDKILLELYSVSTFSTFEIISSNLGGVLLTSAGTPTVVTGQTFTTTTIIQNMETVTNADNGTITFPLIDYSKLYSFYGVSANVLNILNINIPPTMNVLNEDLRPAIFIKRVWDAIFRQAGFKYKSSFLNDSLFKSLIITGGVDETEISSLMFSSKFNPNYLGTFVGGPTGQGVIGLNNTTDVETITSGLVTGFQYNYQHLSQITLGPSNFTHPFLVDAFVDSYTTYAASKNFAHQYAYSTSNNNGIHLPSGNSGPQYYYGYGNLIASGDIPYGILPTAATDGKYNVDAKLSFTSFAMFNNAAPSIPLVNQTRYTLQLLKMSNNSYKYSTNFSTPDNAKWEVVTQKTITRGAISTAPENLVLTLNENVELKKGDCLRVVILGDPNTQLNISGNVYGSRVRVLNDSFVKFSKYGTFSNALITNYATLLPRGIKQRDFILQIAKMFNLYFERDLEDDKTIIIEPRDAYYAQGVVRDFTKKIDYSKDFLIDILSHDFPKKTTFKYADDPKDYLSEEYAKYNLNLQPFGNYLFTSPNEYNINESELELKFAPTYLQKVGDTNLKITKIIDPAKKDPETASKNVPYKIKPRVMFYKKKPIVLPTGHQVVLGEVKTLTTYKKLPTFINSTNAITYTINTYGYAGHLNDPDTPTVDLNWHTDFAYLPGTTPTANNLINIFYKPQLIELSDQSARKVTCFVDLQPVDIHNLRFADVYYFNKEYWRLLTISDYDTSSDVAQTTKCEFIKIVRASTHALIDYTTFGYLGLTGASGGGISGGIFGSTDPETGQPFLMQLNGTSPVDQLNRDTYFEIMDQQNNINHSLVPASGFLDLLTEVSPNNTFRTVEENGSINNSAIANIASNASARPTGGIYYITSETPPADVVVEYDYHTVLFDGVNDRNVLYLVELPFVEQDGYNITFDVANDGDFGIINFTNANTLTCGYYVVNNGNKVECTYILEKDKWSIKRF